MNFSASVVQANSAPKAPTITHSQVKMPSELNLHRPFPHFESIANSSSSTHNSTWLKRALAESIDPAPVGSSTEEIINYWKTLAVYWKSNADQFRAENKSLQAHCRLLDRALSDTKKMISNLIMLSPNSIEPEGVLKNGAKLRAALDTNNLGTVQELLKKTNFIAQKVLLDNFDLRESLNNLYQDNQKLREINQCLEEGKGKIRKELVVESNVSDEQVPSTHKRKRSMSVGNIDLLQLGNFSEGPPKETTQDVIETLGLFDRTAGAVDKHTQGSVTENSISSADLIAAYNQIEKLEMTIKSMVETKFEMIEKFSTELERLRCFVH